MDWPNQNCCERRGGMLALVDMAMAMMTMAMAMMTIAILAMVAMAWVHDHFKFVQVSGNNMQYEWSEVTQCKKLSSRNITLPLVINPQAQDIPILLTALRYSPLEGIFVNRWKKDTESLEEMFISMSITNK